MNTEKQRAFLIHFLYACVLLFLMYILFRHVIYYIMPFFIGFTIAFVLRPIIRFLTRLTNGHEKGWSLCTILVFYGILASILCYLAMKGYLISKNMLVDFPHFYEDSIEPFLQHSFHQVEAVWTGYDSAISQAISSIWDGLQDALTSFISSISGSIFNFLSSFLTSLPHFLLSFLICILSSIFFTSDYTSITGFLYRQFSPKGQMILTTIRHFVMETFFQMIIANIKLMIITFLQLFIGLSFIKVDNALLIAFLITLFDALPILGTGAIMLPWALYAWMIGMSKLAVGLLVVYMVIALVRYIIEPKLLSNQLGLHPILMLLCMYVGARLFGIFGFMCLPMIILVLQNLNEEGIIQLYKMKERH